MFKVIGVRGSGKTTKLLEIAKITGHVIVEPNEKTADYIRHMAKEKNYKVNIISAHEFLRRKHFMAKEKYLVDELDWFLQSIGIEGYSYGPECNG